MIKGVLAGIILLLFCFVIPLHIYTIGADQGIGIQGTFYRYQVTGYGSMLITTAQDILYIISKTYSQRTVISILLWVTGSIYLVIATLINLMRPENSNLNNPTVSGSLLIGAGLFYVVSCIAQFGIFFNGPAGISLPFGGFLLMLLGVGSIMNPSLFYSKSTEKA
jgi:hypothetical protein